MEKLVAWKFIVRWFGRQCKFRDQNSEMNAKKYYAIRAYVLLNHRLVRVDTEFNLPVSVQKRLVSAASTLCPICT